MIPKFEITKKTQKKPTLMVHKTEKLELTRNPTISINLTPRKSKVADMKIQLITGNNFIFTCILSKRKEKKMLKKRNLRKCHTPLDLTVVNSKKNPTSSSCNHILPISSS